MSDNKLIMHIVGNRPQFIKLAPISREMRRRNINNVIIHTGQHYDDNMSKIFFDEMHIPIPDENLNVGSATHAQMTAKAMIEIEKVINKYNPAIVVLYGDTNSTLAGALVSSKLQIPIAHIEAGPRTFDKNNPEECNRIVTDHLSKLLFCPDNVSVNNLKAEGVISGVYNYGDVMYDAFLYFDKMGNDNILKECEIEKNNYILMTWHRQENTSSVEKMKAIIDFIEKVEYKIVLPLHPRTRKLLNEYGLWERANNLHNLKIINPIGYSENVALISNCKMIITDSGGLSKESSFGKVRCLFMMDLKPWPDLIDCGIIKNTDITNKNNHDEAYRFIREYAGKSYDSVSFYGNGDTAGKIVDVIADKIGIK